MRDKVVDRYQDNFEYSRKALNTFNDDQMIQGLADGIFAFMSKITVPLQIVLFIVKCPFYWRMRENH